MDNTHKTLKQCCRAVNLLNKILVPYKLVLDVDFFNVSNYEFSLYYFTKDINYMPYEIDEHKNIITLPNKQMCNKSCYFMVESLYCMAYNNIEHRLLNKWYDLDTLILGADDEPPIFDLDKFYYVNVPKTNIKQFTSTSLDELELKLDLCGM
jgi:hypothetical protein